MKEKLKEAIMIKTVDRKLSCAVARKMAEDLGISYSSAGAVSDERGIKINNCRPVCF
jgi:hypothetical protein